MVQINNNAQPVAEGAYDAPVVGLIRVQNYLLQIFLRIYFIRDYQLYSSAYPGLTVES